MTGKELGISIDSSAMQDSQRHLIYGVARRIDRRVERTLANPNLTPEQKMELFTLANLTKFVLSLGNPLAVDFAKELIAFSDPLMILKKS